MVYIDFKDIDGLKLNSQQGADMGFTGKQVIHPNNIETVQSVYSPRNEIHEKFIFLLSDGIWSESLNSAEKIEWAAELIREFELHSKSGKGAFTFKGQMIDMPLVKQANNILQFA